MKAERVARQNLIFECLAGSHAYGMATIHSDRDTRGVFVAPPEHAMSVFFPIEQYIDNVSDTVFYELRKFMRLAAACNPNIIELLFAPRETVLFMDPAFELLIENRKLFLSRKARQTFCGYAASQLKRIKGHHRWINNPQPQREPRLADYCCFVDTHGNVVTSTDLIEELNESCVLVKTFGEDHFRVFRPHNGHGRRGFFTDDGTQPQFLAAIDEDAEYLGLLWIDILRFRREHKAWRQYWQWKRNRNPVRAELEKKFGFDTKHAAHLVRLMEMAEEILTSGTVNVRRPNADRLLAIREGRLHLDELIHWAEAKQRQLEQLATTSQLPEGPDLSVLDRLYRQVVQEYWNSRGLTAIALPAREDFGDWHVTT